ncbi:MAG: glycosyltransferase family 2 protein [Candidatus Tectimicrobiota bacterium]
MTLVSVIIVTWNNADEIAACLESVEAQSHRPLEVIVIDNASDDGTAEVVAKAFPHVQVCRNEHNGGFSRGCNQGIGLATGDFLLFLNPDARLAPSYVARLLEGLRADPSVGSAGGKFYLSAADPKRLDSTGIRLGKARWAPYDRGHGQVDNGQYNHQEHVFGITAAAALYRRQALEECRVDGEVFDEDFFAYYEDADLAWRAQLLGWRALYVPEAVVYHSRKGPRAHSSRVEVLANRNRYLLFLKNEQRSSVFTHLGSMVAYELGRCAKRLVTRPALLLAIPLALVLVPRMWRKRRATHQQALVPPGYIKQFY